MRNASGPASDLSPGPHLFQSAASRWFFEYWRNLPRTEVIPSSESFLDRPPFALMPFVYIHDLTDAGLVTRFMGTALVARWNRDRTDQLFAEDLTPELRARLIGQVKYITGQPCGLVQTGDFAAGSGRAITYEAVLLPLAVQVGRPPRVVTFSELLGAFDDFDAPERLASTGTQTWLDLGVGVPATPPLAVE